MKPLFTKFATIVFLAVLLPFMSSAQNNKSAQQSETTITQKDNAERMATIKDLPELHKQLVAQFGENFSLESQEVRVVLMENIKETKASERTRKTSLYAYYGQEYRKYLNLINTTTK